MKWPEFNKFDLKSRTILLGYVGSIAHGTYIEQKNGGIDDKDVMGIVVPPKQYYLGLQQFEQVDTWVDEYDIVIYEIKKFFRLLLKCNPNVVGLLWLQPNHYIQKHPVGEKLIKNRNIFSSRQAYKSFTGYAYGQLKRMNHLSFDGYMGKKRKEIVEQFGYDTKNAAHLIRLLRMGIEFLSTGELNVLRHDSQQLIQIKKGEFTLDEIKNMADDLFKKSEMALINSHLPNHPDEVKAEELLMECISVINKEFK